MDARERIEAALAEATAGGLPGIAAAARLADGTVIEAAAGVRGLDNPAPMTPDTVFWIASFTKALTTAAVLQLVEAGRVELDAPVARWLPALAAPKVLTGFDASGAPQLADAKIPITVRQLLAHTSGLAYEFCNAELARHGQATQPAPLGAAAGVPLVFEPGSGWTYGVGLDWAGELVTAVTGQTLDVYLAEHVFAPLGMTETSFLPASAQADRRASMHGRGEGGALAPIPFGLPPPPHPSMGGGGAYSTARDYLKFLEAILAGGAPILAPASLALMTGNEWEGPEVACCLPSTRHSVRASIPSPARRSVGGSAS